MMISFRKADYQLSNKVIYRTTIRAVPDGLPFSNEKKLFTSMVKSKCLSLIRFFECKFGLSGSKY